jgi:hypothetical protein
MSGKRIAVNLFLIALGLWIVYGHEIVALPSLFGH